jgi:hypothetical protein
LVIGFSFPVILIEELLKIYSRRRLQKSLEADKKDK